MRGLRTTVSALIAVLVLAGQAQAAINRVSGPTDLLFEGRAFVKFDIAYDSTNRVYLVVWGTQLTGPVNGLFLNEAGAMVGAPFAISDGPVQSGWARVLYNAAYGKFLVSYTKIVAAGQHQKAVKFVTYGAGMGPEILLDAWAGGAGTESGIAYSPLAGGRFFVTWWKWAPNPVSYVAMLDAAGQVLAVYPLTNPADGQSDPEIACDPVNNRCLVVGLSWGVLAGGNPSNWGRFINATTGAPEGPDSFYLTSWPRLMEDQGVVYSEAAGRFIVGYIRDAAGTGQVVNGADGGVGAPFIMRQTSPATVNQDGGGYGSLNLSYNAATQSTMMSAVAWSGYPVAQELNANGAPIDGALDFVPNGGGAGSPAPWDLRSKYAMPAANPVAREFLLIDNHYFQLFRVSRYSTGSSPGGGGVRRPAVHDISGDGVTDLLWQHRSTGTLAVWTLSGSTATDGFYINAGAPDPSWRVAGSGDVNGDGFADVVWRHPSGPVAVWYLQGANVIGAELVVMGGSPASQPDPSWEIRGVGDLNGDGRSDLIWQHAVTGHLGAWLLNGATVTSADFLSVPFVGDTSWVLAGSADVTGDGKADLVWQHRGNGGLYVWVMNGLQVVHWSPLSINGVSDLTWEIRGVGDTNRDGFADLLWYHTATGTVGVWHLNGFTVVGAHLIGAVLDWEVVGPG